MPIDFKHNVLDYYRVPGEITRLKKHTAFIKWLPDDIGAIYQVVQGLIAHDMWLSHYGTEYKVDHEYPQNTAYMEDLLDKALELDSSNLAIPRHPRDRVIACCREFATLMTAILRAKGIPARSRCGFAAYFGWDGKYEDHWICEYWDGVQWIMTDPQLDPFQQGSILNWTMNSVQDVSEKIELIREFNPRKLRQGDFITAGQAWKLCREVGANPGDFGISCPIRPEWNIDSLYGLWFVRGQLLRDFAALNKIETVPYLVRICKGLDWKPWRLVAVKDSELTPDDYALLDNIAALSLDTDENLDVIRQIYTSNEDVTTPCEITSR
jgi:hypothetical protein